MKDKKKSGFENKLMKTLLYIFTKVSDIYRRS